MKITVNPSRKATQMLLLHQVPRALISPFTMDVVASLDTLEIPQEKSTRLVRVSQQTRAFNYLLKHLPVEPRIIVFASTGFYLQARRAALIVFYRYLQHSLNYPKQHKDSTPVWYMPTVGFNNTLLQAYDEGKHHQPNLLLLDGLYDDMPASKVDKIHDIMQMMANRPCLLILRSRDPFHHCINKFGVRPNNLLYFAKQRRTQVI